MDNCGNKVTYLCVGDDCLGKSNKGLKEAYDDYIDQTGSDERPEDLTFYEATEVDVEVKIQKKEVVTKITAAKK